MRREANLKLMKLSLMNDDPPEIVMLKRGTSYYAIVTEIDRVKNVLTMRRPMPTVTAALEYLLDMTAEHLATMEDKVFAGRATPPGQPGEMVENDLWLNSGRFYVPSLTPSATSEAAPSTSEMQNSTESESPLPTSVDETPPPSYSTLQIADRLATPFASPTERGPRVQAGRRRASAMEETNEDDTIRGDTLRRSTRRRYDNQ
jgi:hypothetical protein